MIKFCCWQLNIHTPYITSSSQQTHTNKTPLPFSLSITSKKHREIPFFINKTQHQTYKHKKVTFSLKNPKHTT
ncbi:hypothetical protein HanXRQr2_Chr11g0505471 [Helianthus annuus]|uniref:Uncharacterized protein n=1 Tax=Helianthus annuus TaxID=4232 RepID=A0A251TC48_HELAN|nr:hypothetical protein HanXRQr2_Chr11g0505471 [Helianthus annuus]